MDKTYVVYFIVKQNGHGYLKNEVISAPNMKDAIGQVKRNFKASTGKTAFSCTCRKPKAAHDGMMFNNRLYSYSNKSDILW